MKIMVSTQKQWISNFLIFSSLKSKGLIAHLSYGARQAHLQRDYAQLKIAGEKLIDLSPHTEHIGRYYLLLSNRKHWEENNTDLTRNLECIAQSAPLPVRSMAMTALAGKEILSNNADSATVTLLLESSALSTQYGDYLNFIQAQSQLSLLCSINGDHRNSLQILRGLQPIVNKIGNQYDAVRVDFCNSVAFELAKLGMIEPAKVFASVVIKSPHLAVYPEWQENTSEILVNEHKRTSIAFDKVFVEQRNNVLKFPVKTLAPKMMRVEITIDGCETVSYGQCSISRLAAIRTAMQAEETTGLQRNTDNATK